MKHFKIDWQEQWALHAEGYADGRAHISLSPYGVEKTCLLAPGAGFGDFSHPTTRLMLHLMAPLVKEKMIIDIGSGSGILTICALLMGAKKSIGIEIDSLAVEHAKNNAALNQIEVDFLLPHEISSMSSEVVLMNMICAEQKCAWETYKKWIPRPRCIITSGILSSDQNNYLSLANSWGWSLVTKQQEEEWMGFIFEK